MSNSTSRSLVVLSSVLGLAIMGGAVEAFQGTEISDVNGDGVISADEIRQVREADKAAALLQYDTDGNGELSRLERRAMRDDRYASMLEQFDADGDGELSRDERGNARDARHAAVEVLLDVNQDGVLSEEEQAGFEQIREERKASRSEGRGKRGHGDRG